MKPSRSSECRPDRLPNTRCTWCAAGRCVQVKYSSATEFALARNAADSRVQVKSVQLGERRVTGKSTFDDTCLPVVIDWLSRLR